MTEFPPGEASRLCLTNELDLSQLTIYQQGAHITSWRTQDGEEHLYTSPKALYQPGKAIRGGVPLIFPQFSDLGPLPVSHGFLRVSPQWSVRGSAQKGSVYELVLEYLLKPQQERYFAEAHCKLVYTITFTAATLRLHIRLANLSTDRPLTFAFAFHSYFAVADAHKVRIHGLDETAYLDDLQNRKPCAPEAVHFINGEIDRIYLNQDDRPVTLQTTSAKHQTSKQLTITGDGFKDVVLWNPWVEKTKGMADMPEDGFKKFVCVEHGTIIDKPQLSPHETWEASQMIVISQPVGQNLPFLSCKV
ncbi:unnamed protein product [Phytomonas sp. Hart1]|nr:unnamed protein product [Phytomonas sp. Hart1]|eukprot:CCW71096.1 unnamed protein product [Phytomonas sp. isolate Hart1]